MNLDTLIDVDVNGRKYRIYKCNAFEQLDMVADLFSMVDIGSIKALDKNPMAAIMMGFSKLAPSERQSLIKRMLKKVYIQNKSNSYDPLFSNSGQLMFDNLDMFDIVNLIVEVLIFNIGNFSERAMQLSANLEAKVKSLG